MDRRCRVRPRAKCPWCGKWQNGDGTGEHDNEACAGQYARRRGTAIFVRVKVGEVYHRPLKRHIRQALDAAG